MHLASCLNPKLAKQIEEELKQVDEKSIGYARRKKVLEYYYKHFNK